MPGFELFGESERSHVNDVLNTGIIMRYGFDGPRKGIWKSKELEAAISNKLGAQYTQVVSSGTAALVTALAAMGVGSGDEVIMPTFTFVASFEAVITVGAVPVLVDVDDTLTLDPAAVRAAITPKTKVIMPVHMCGSMADMDALMQICKEHKLLLLEDACQSTGAKYKGKYLGTIGDAGTFSFDFVKTVTCGEGGAITTNSEEIWRKCDGYSDHGHDHLGVDRGADLHPFLGYNFRISELHAAVGLAQFNRLDEFLAIMKRNFDALKAALAAVPEISFRRIPDPSGDSHTHLSWFLPTREATANAVALLKAEGQIAGSIYWYDHNWHYIRNWAHLKAATSLNELHPDQKKAVIHHANKDFSASDAVIGRSVSTQISLLWSEEQAREKGEKMAQVIRKSLSGEVIKLKV